MSKHLPHHLVTLQQNLLHGKLPRNLSWAETIELIDHLGVVQPEGNEEFLFLVGTERELFKHPSTHDMSVQEVSRLRKFLKLACFEVVAEAPLQPSRMIVVLDHHAAHVYSDFGDSEPQDRRSVKPYDPFGFHHHLLHRKEANYAGEHIPEDRSFYEEIAQDLRHAVEIVVIGHGTGKSNAAEHLVEYLQATHADIARRIKGVEKADLSAITEPQIEALAKQHMIVVV